MNLLIATTAAFALLISTVSAGAVRVFLFFFLFLSISLSNKIIQSYIRYLTNLITVVTNLILLQSCTKPFGSGYCHDDQTGDMLRCSTVCIHFFARPLHLPYLLHSTLSMECVCYGSCTFFFVFFSSSLFPWKTKIIRKFSNEILIMNFVFVFLLCF